VEMKDGIVRNAGPKDVLGYVAVPFAKWLERLPYA
jgi:hypothetical protein